MCPSSATRANLPLEHRVDRPGDVSEARGGSSPRRMRWRGGSSRLRPPGRRRGSSPWQAVSSRVGFGNRPELRGRRRRPDSAIVRREEETAQAVACSRSWSAGSPIFASPRGSGDGRPASSVGQPALLGQREMVLVETCRMAATSAVRRQPGPWPVVSPGRLAATEHPCLRGPTAVPEPGTDGVPASRLAAPHLVVPPRPSGHGLWVPDTAL
jgi:hypothetical protein